MYIITY